MMNPIKRLLLALSFALCLLSVAVFSWIDDHHSAESQYRGNTLLPESSLSFSAAPGFYSESFLLEISAPTDEIYYTLDGTDPDRSSLRYTGPIRIDDATNQPNVHSARTDVSAGFLPEAGAYTAPDYLVDKCTIIRAACYDKYGNRSAIRTATYFVGFDEKPAYDNVHVLSILTDPDHLFDYETGIYVMGHDYDHEFEFRQRPWWWWDANYHNRGPEWERRGTIQLFDADHNAVLTQDVGLRIQGGGSRGYAQKSFNLYAREEYDGNTNIHYDFWNTGYIPDKLTLSVCGDDYPSKIKDRLGAELMEGLQFATMHYLPCLVFLDGEFWGLYYITEKYDPHYIQYTYHVDEENVVFVKNGELDYGFEEDMTAYTDMKNYLLWAYLEHDEAYQGASEYVDMENMLDYLAAMICIGRTNDWNAGGNNSQMWRSRKPGSSPYADCRWRWTVFDLNSAGSMDHFFARHDTIHFIREASPMVSRLFDNKQFQEELVRRIITYSQTRFSKEQAHQKIDSYLEELDACYDAHIKRFGISDSAFQADVDNVRGFFNERYDYLIDLLKTYYPDLDIDAMQAASSAS